MRRNWKKTSTNETIEEEENDDYDYNDEGETVYPDRHVDYDDVSGDEADETTFRRYDNIDHKAAVKIQSNFRGYRTRRNLSNRQC